MLARPETIDSHPGVLEFIVPFGIETDRKRIRVSAFQRRIFAGNRRTVEPAAQECSRMGDQAHNGTQHCAIADAVPPAAALQTDHWHDSANSGCQYRSIPNFAGGK